MGKSAYAMVVTEVDMWIVTAVPMAKSNYLAILISVPVARVAGELIAEGMDAIGEKSFAMIATRKARSSARAALMELSIVKTAEAAGKSGC